MDLLRAQTVRSRSTFKCGRKLVVVEDDRGELLYLQQPGQVVAGVVRGQLDERHAVLVEVVVDLFQRGYKLGGTRISLVV